MQAAPILGDWRRILPFALLLITWNVVCWHLPFFWDNILNARIAQWYLADGFGQLTVPEALDAGHPPFFSLYLALVWKVFGASLPVAHMAMLPFLLLAQWAGYRLATRFLPAHLSRWALLIPFLEPALLAQSAQVSPDVALLAFYLCALVAMLERRRAFLMVCLAAMAAVSFRGILCYGIILLSDVAVGVAKGERRIQWRALWPYVGATLLVLAWLSWHQRETGWLLSAPDTTYGGHRKWAGLSGMLRNVGVIGWRILDHGRVLLFGALGLLLVLRRRSLLADDLLLLALLLLPILGLSVLFAPFTNPVGHRYFLPAYFLAGLLFLRLALAEGRPLLRGLWIGVVAAGLLSGHAWVYPDAVAKGWDATLAHLPYHGLRRSAVARLEAMGIPRHAVCSDFPALSAESFLDPTQPGTEQFLPKREPLTDCPWVLYTNVSNGFSDAELAQLQDSTVWRPVHREGGWPVRVVLYERIP